ncbi:hypothetical protein [Thermostaphylospora chromogena]|uniref:hypothetical protein n=1 Tax=Thermostaphylospora chromogena TaxID=35622 RepID=UPI001041FCE8|nr:hypothetical protein [Thermostaphylospora chromogena]
MIVASPSGGGGGVVVLLLVLCLDLVRLFRFSLSNSTSAYTRCDRVTDAVIEPPGPSMKRVRGMKKFLGRTKWNLRNFLGLHLLALTPSGDAESECVTAVVECSCGAATAAGVTAARVMDREPATVSAASPFIGRTLSSPAWATVAFVRE